MRPKFPRNKRTGGSGNQGSRGPRNAPASVDLPPLPGEPLVLPRDQHSISRRQIDGDALKVMYRLLNHGHRALLVGGGVRDLLLGKTPKDFDVSTDARPEEVRRIFRNSRIIGRRFRINHVYFRGNKIIDVSTFRALVDAEESSEESGNEEDDSLLIRDDNTYGDPESDAFRRDLTINGLFYDLKTFSVIDYVGGVKDLRDGIVRAIGDPDVRFQEDPVRMMRAVRHAARTDFVIEEKTLAAIHRWRGLLEECPKARLFEELQKDLRGGSAEAGIKLFADTGVLEFLLPGLHSALSQRKDEIWPRLKIVLQELDRAVDRQQEWPLSLIFAAMFLGNLQEDDLAEDKKLKECFRQQSFFWNLHPQANSEVEDESQEGAVLQRLKDGPRRGRSRGRKIPKSGLRQVIDELLSIVSVPRKERDRMELLLIGRRKLFLNCSGEAFVRKMRQAVYFRDVFKFLELTAFDSETKKLVEFWRKQLPNGKPARSRRRRRRKRQHKSPSKAGTDSARGSE